AYPRACKKSGDLVQFGKHCLPCDRPVADCDTDLCAGGNKNVDTRSKLDETELLTLVYGLTLLHIAAYSSRHSASNLADQNLQTISHAYDQRGALVLRARLGMPGYEITTRMIPVKAYYTSDGQTVDMDVYGRHEDRYLRTALL